MQEEKEIVSRTLHIEYSDGSAKIIDKPFKHNRATYTNLGCRCKVCRQAHTEYYKNWVKNVK